LFRAALKTQQLESESCFTGVVRAGWLYVDGLHRTQHTRHSAAAAYHQITSWVSTPADQIPNEGSMVVERGCTSSRGRNEKESL
jgi:hypothetical protein